MFSNDAIGKKAMNRCYTGLACNTIT